MQLEAKQAKYARIEEKNCVCCSQSRTHGTYPLSRRSDRNLNPNIISHFVLVSFKAPRLRYKGTVVCKSSLITSHNNYWFGALRMKLFNCLQHSVPHRQLSFDASPKQVAKRRWWKASFSFGVPLVAMSPNTKSLANPTQNLDHTIEKYPTTIIHRTMTVYVNAKEI